MKKLLLLILLSLQTDAANVGGQLKNAQLENRGADYASGVRGRVWYRTDLGLCRYDDGSTIREFLTANVAQTVTNKDIDGGTASNTSRITLPKAATATLDALTRKEATVVYDTTTKEVKADDGAVLVPQMPVGTILHYGGATAPNGYLLGDGAAISRTTYAALFAVVSTAFGVGDGFTTFNKPNCQGRSLFGSGGALTVIGNTIGSVGGNESTTLTTTELPAHDHGSSGLTAVSDGAHIHGISDPGHSHTTALNDNDGSTATYSVDLQTPADASAGTTYNVFDTDTKATGIGIIMGGSHTHPISGSTDSEGSGNAFSNVPPALVVNCIVKY